MMVSGLTSEGNTGSARRLTLGDSLTVGLGIADGELPAVGALGCVAAAGDVDSVVFCGSSSVSILQSIVEW